MALAETNFNQIRRRVREAYKDEDPMIRELRDFARQLAKDVRTLQPFPGNTFSFASDDSGNSRVHFNPAVIEIIRVHDSEGNEHALDAIAGNSDPEDLNDRIKPGSPLNILSLQNLCREIKIDVLDLSYFLRGMDEPGKSAGAIKIYRDIVEWAVLYDLIKFREWKADTILVKEGLLRTKSFTGNIFPEIDKQIRQCCHSHKEKNIRLSIVGVAKKSVLLTRLGVAFELEETFFRPYPCFVQIPGEMEGSLHFDSAWLDTQETGSGSDGKYSYQSMGQLFLVKFGDRPFDPVWPVDLAEWDVEDAPQIIGRLVNDAQTGFPVPDFPMCIQKAHDFARLNALEASVLQNILIEEMTRNFTPSEKEKTLRIKYLTESLTKKVHTHA